MLMPFCGNSLVFRFQAVSKTLRAECLELLKSEGRLLPLESTSAEFKNKAAALVDATTARNLTSTEAARIGEHPQHLTAQNRAASKLLEAECAEKEFYDAFKKRCVLLQIECGDAPFRNYTHAVFRLLDQRMTQKAGAQGQSSLTLADRTKVDTVKVNFCKRLYADIIHAYAIQPIDQITIESYKTKVAELKALFIHKNQVDIEASLRQALKSHHRTQALNLAADAYLDSNPLNIKVAVLGTPLLLQRLTAEKDALEAELSALAGTTGINGSVHDAWTRSLSARTAFETASSDFVAAFRSAFDHIPSLLPVEQLTAMNLEGCPEDVVSAKTALCARLLEYRMREEEYQQLLARLGELATFDPADGVTITGGQVVRARQKLNAPTLECLARDEATKIGNFYHELSKPVTDANKQARYNKMHRVLCT
jgi:hypothetical protein